MSIIAGWDGMLGFAVKLVSVVLALPQRLDASLVLAAGRIATVQLWGIDWQLLNQML